jgi:hypothetical protein
MGSFRIQDGSGTGRLCKVTSDGRLDTFSVSETEEDKGVIAGTSFNIETPIITLTTGNKSGLLYVKNDDELDLILTGFFTLTGASTGGSGYILVEHEYNPTSAGSTLISAGTDVLAVNKSVGNARQLNATIKYGAEGSTVDAGLKKITGLHTGTGQLVLSVTINLTKGASIAVSITPQAGNTSMPVIAAIDCYLKTLDL